MTKLKRSSRLPEIPLLLPLKRAEDFYRSEAEMKASEERFDEMARYYLRYKNCNHEVRLKYVLKIFKALKK